MTQTSVSNLQASLTLTEFVDINGVFPPRGGSGSGPFIGSIGIFASPESSLFDAPADGQLYPISQYTALFSILGTDFGGNGTSNFELPNLGGAEMIGAGNGPGLPPYVLGEMVGQTGYDLTQPQLPPSLGGTSAPVNNYQPSLAVNYVINTQGVYPSGSLTLNSLGVVSAFLGNFAPGDELFCDGQLLPISQYEALFSLLGTTYGGDGVTTFALPDLRGRDIVGYGPGFTLGEQVGTANVNLTNANSPLGSDAPIDNQQPGLVLNYYIALQGIYPSQGQAGNSNQTTPFIGQIVASAASISDPAGWALCEGQLLPISQNQALFSLLGTTYGGNGTTNFALPNLEGQTVLGSGGSNGLGTVGQVSGANTIKLTSGNVAVPAPTVSVTSVLSATAGEQIALSSLVTVSNPGDVSCQLQLWDSDGTTAGGEFRINGVAQTANHAINVPSGASVVFDAGTSAGTDTLWARLLQNDNSLTSWQQFTVTVPSPSLTVHNLPFQTSNSEIGLSQLVTIADPGHAGYQQLELWDTNGTGAGGFWFANSQLQTGGHEIDVAPADVGGVFYFSGIAAGTDTLWARLQLNDGSLTPWQQFTVTVPQPALLVIPNTANTPSFALSSVITIIDAGHVGYRQLELWDTDGSHLGGQLFINGHAQTGGQEIDVPDLTGVTYSSPLGGTDTLWARLQLNDGSLTGWQRFTVTMAQPTLSVQSQGNTGNSPHALLGGAVNITDPLNVGYQQLQLWDTNGTHLGGQFIVNGQPQTGGHEIDVPQANASSVSYSPPLGGTDTLWVRLLQNDGSLTAWQQFTETNLKPNLNVQSQDNPGNFPHILLGGAVNITDPLNVGYQQLQLWDTNGTHLGGQFIVNGQPQTGGHEIDVPQANASSVSYSPPLGGTDTLWARLLQNDGSLTAWQQFTETNSKPTLLVQSQNVGTINAAQPIFTSAVHIFDALSVGYQQLQLWDTDGTLIGGHLTVNGQNQTGGHEIDVAQANVSSVSYSPPFGGTDTLWARLLQNDGSLTPWQQFTVSVPQPTLTVHNFTTATPGQVIHLTSLVTTSDPASVAYKQLELWDSNGTAATGQFMVNGQAQTGGHEIDVAFINLGNTVFDEGTTGNTDTLWARLEQNDGTLTPWQQFTVVDPVTIGQGATVELNSAYAGHAIFGGTSGTLQLDKSADFSGTVAGMNGQDTLDFRDINFTTASSPIYSGDSSGGTLRVTDGTHTANIALLGDYLASTFVTSSDDHGGTLVVDPPISQTGALAQPMHA